MRSKIYILFCLFLVLSCRNRETDEVSDVVPVIIPQITLKGAEYVSLGLNETYTDLGATMYDSLDNIRKDLEPVSNNIDVTTPGLYVVTFNYRNRHGFEKTTERYIAVTSVNPSIDLSGSYVRSANDAPVNVEKISTGLYKIDNVGGVIPPSDAVLPVVMAMINDSVITIPSQSVPNGYGTLDCSEETIQFSPDTSFSYIVENSGFGAAVRTFIKQ